MAPLPNPTTLVGNNYTVYTKNKANSTAIHNLKINININ